MGKSQDLYKKAKKIIPGATQLLSKKQEIFLPDLWPAYYDRAKGCEVWDLDGKKYTDMSWMGIGACLLGYRDPDVDRAVKEVIDKGAMTTLNCPEEVELADVLCGLHPWASMARYARTGGEAMAVAVRIARAYTQKDMVLVCGYHGWHDWYLAANLSDDKSLDGHLLPGLKPRGVPRGLTGTAVPFHYNDTGEFLALFRKYRKKIAAVVMEPVRNYFPEKGFLETIRETTKREKIVLVFDEITSGFRLTDGGAHLIFKVSPDIAVFGKGMSNGYAMAAVIGVSRVMDAAQDTFISSTYWTERIGPAAALATIKKLRQKKVPLHLGKTGKEIQAGWKRLAGKHKLGISVSGIYPLGHFDFKDPAPEVLKTLFTQLMLDRGFLAGNSFYSSYAHTKGHVKRYLEAVDESFAFIKHVLAKGNPERYLKGPVCQSTFARLT